MTIQIKGKLTSPIVGGVCAGAVLRFTADSGSTTTVPYATSEITTEANGDYSLVLEYGHYAIWIKLEDTFEYLGYCIVDETSPAHILF
jgi:hypothetical protein